VFGTGADLQLYHENSGNNGMIFNKTGDLYIQGNDGSDAAQTAIQIHSNGAVDLKYAGAGPKLSTTASGAKVTGKLEVDGRLGIGADSTTVDSTALGAALVVNQDPVDRAAYYSPDGSYYAAFGTVDDTHTKAWISIDSAYNKSSAVSAGIFLRAYHGDANSSNCGYTIKNLKSDNSLVFSSVVTGESTSHKAVESEKVRFAANGNATFAGSVYVSSDSNKIYAGAENEMQVFHSGTDSVIKDTRNAGSIKLQADNFSVIDKDAGQTLLSAVVDGSTKLFWGGATNPKFETTSTGAKVTGRLDTTGAAHIGGQNTVHAANTLALGHEGSSKSQIRAYGADASTKGILEFKFTTSDGSANDPDITFSGGGATFGGAMNGTTATFNTGTAGTFKIQGTSTGTNVNTGDAGTYLQLRNLSTNANTFTVLQGADGSGQGTSQIAFVNLVDGTNQGQMVFSTRPANGSMTSALTINSTQKASFAGAVSVAQKPVTQTKTDISASEIDCSTGNYFYKAITTGEALVLTFTGLPSSGEAYGMIVEIKFSGDASQTTIQWPTSVTWADGGSAPTFTEDKTQVYSLITHDGGTKWRASHLKDYTN